VAGFMKILNASICLGSFEERGELHEDSLDGAALAELAMRAQVGL